MAEPRAVPAATAPANQPLPEPAAWQAAPQGLTHFRDGSCAFRVWAPHASAVTLQAVPAESFVPTAAPSTSGNGGEAAAEAEADAVPAIEPDSVSQQGMQEYALSRHVDDWGIDLVRVGAGWAGPAGLWGAALQCEM